MGGLSVESKIHLLTKYINKKLRHDIRIENWGFSINPTLYEQGTLIVEIDYLGNFHSSNVFTNIDNYEHTTLYDMFDVYFEKHVTEWFEHFNGGDNYGENGNE